MRLINLETSINNESAKGSTNKTGDKKERVRRKGSLFLHEKK